MKKLFSFMLMYLFAGISGVYATKLVSVKVLDKDYLMLYFLDGEVTYVDNGQGSNAYSSTTNATDNALVTYGTAMNTTNAATAANWTIKSGDDANYGTTGKKPSNVYRKSKLSGLSQEAWNSSTNDFNYDWAYEHTIYIKLPSSMVQGKTYTIELNGNINSDVNTKTFTFDMFTSKSEAIKINLAGYLSNSSIKAADVYMWMGDGGARDYTAFQGNDIYIYNVSDGTSQKVGTLSFWKAAATEFTDGHKMLQSAVWKADFTGFQTPGTYRLAVSGIGCSEDFTISADAYFNPLKVSTLGFLYMRIGQDTTGGLRPVPRRPLWIPGSSPSDCKILITTMHPYHANWNTFCSGDKWDCKNEWAVYSTGRENKIAKGGHSDALDWDRHLGHVPIIYDMLLPYFLTNGGIPEDNLGIPESGNGIPDVIDEAKNEVDFWLSLRDGKGYSHGLNNPNSSNIFYQSANTAVAAWANAANAAMLANCYMIAGKTALMNQYRDSAVNAYNYANALSDQMLDKMVDRFSGKDFKATAAAFLYNITGNTAYETMLNSLSSCTSTTSTIQSSNQNQLYAVAAYLKTNRTVNYPTLFSNMKASLIAEAKSKEANFSSTRPSRRGSDNTTGWFVNEMVIQRTIVAHSIIDAGADKTLFENALILEADWTLGRNPLNMIQMTTATTPLASKKSVSNAYTSGWNDGTPGVHPGHTPYMNIFDWGGTMVMGNPTWMANKNYPTAFSGSASASTLQWPMGEMYFNVRYVYAANEFTPQQTMRGKQALYGYLHAISPAAQQGCAIPKITGPASICGLTNGTLQTGLNASSKTFTWYKDGVKINGQSGNNLVINQGGSYKVDVDSAGCIKSSEMAVGASLKINLGNETTLCSSNTLLLDAGNTTIPNVGYLWSNGTTNHSITVSKAGNYSVTVSAANCPAVNGAVTVTSKLLDIINDTLCYSGLATLSVNGSSSYNWYDVAQGGNVLAKGTSYSPSVSSTKTYYVEEASGTSGSLGKATAGTGSAWGLGAGYFTETDKVNKVSVTKAITLESIAVYTTQASTDVTINFKQNGTVVHTKTVTVSGAGKQTIPLGFLLQPGDYIIDADGTNNELTFEASGATFPYEFAGYLSFTYSASWQSSWYGMFYDWKVKVGSGCVRTPVTAVLDASSSKCSGINTQNIQLNQGWNLISFYVSPTNKTIDTVFKSIITDLNEIKTMEQYWSASQPASMNSLTSINDGEAYLVKMKKNALLQVSGKLIQLPFAKQISNGWNLSGNPSSIRQDIATKVGSQPINAIKNFEGFWLPSGTFNSLFNFDPGKGYFIKSNGASLINY